MSEKQIRNLVKRLGIPSILKGMGMNDDPEERHEIRKLFGAKPARTSQMKSLLYRTRTELTPKAQKVITEIMEEEAHKLQRLGWALKEKRIANPVIFSLLQNDRTTD